MKRKTRQSHNGFSELRRWIRTSIPLEGVRRDLFAHVADCERRERQCSVAVGAELNRAGHPLMAEMRHGELFVFALDGVQASLLLNAPNGATMRQGLSPDSPPPVEGVELIAFEIEEFDPGDPHGRIAGTCDLRFAPGYDPFEAVTFTDDSLHPAPPYFPGFEGDPDMHEPNGFVSPAFAQDGPSHCFALDFDLDFREAGRPASIQETRYSYLWLPPDLKGVRFEFAPVTHAPGREAILPQAIPFHLRLCAAPPRGSSIRPKPLSRAMASILVFQ